MLSVSKHHLIIMWCPFGKLICGRCPLVPRFDNKKNVRAGQGDVIRNARGSGWRGKTPQSRKGGVTAQAEKASKIEWSPFPAIPKEGP